MVTEASAALGISPYYLRKWITEGKEGFGPSRKVMFGPTQIYLYTEDDLERIKENHQSERIVTSFDGSRGKGRPRIYTDAERRKRGRLQSRRYYWKVRFEEATFKGDIALMKKATNEIKTIDKRLKGKQDDVRSSSEGRTGT